MNPHDAPAFGDAPELGNHRPPRPQLVPEPPIFRAVGIAGLDEHRMAPGDELGGLVAEHCQEVLVGPDDGTVRLELDDRLRAVERSKLGLGASRRTARHVEKIKHGPPP